MVERTGVRGISRYGRASQGVQLMNMREGEDACRRSPSSWTRPAAATAQDALEAGGAEALIEAAAVGWSRRRRGRGAQELADEDAID